MDETDLKKMLEAGTVLVNFSAGWCAPCKVMAPVIDRISDHYREQLRVISIDIDKSHELALEYMVHSIPCLILFRQAKEIRRLVGIQAETDLEVLLDRVLETGTDPGETRWKR